MKLIVSSDWHLDWQTAGMRRFDDLRIAIEATVRSALQERADGYLFLGDLCDPDSGPITFSCVELAISTALLLRNNGIASYWLAGNHDVIEDGSGETTLSPLRALSTGTSEEVTGAIYVLDRPGVVFLPGKIPMLALPFTATSHTYDPAQQVTQFGQKHRKTGGIIAGHLQIPGIIPGAETTEMPRGRDIQFPVDACRASETPLLLMNGHYHRQQEFDTNAGKIHIPGSLERLTFGEQTHEPGWFMIEVT